MLLLYIISFCIFEIETADFKNYLGFSIIGGVLVETTFPCSLFLGIFGHVGFIHGWLSICPWRAPILDYPHYFLQTFQLHSVSKESKIAKIYS